MLPKRQPTIIIFVLVIVSLILLSNYVGADVPDDKINTIITSRFILWDTNEKMIDSDFTIHLININQSINNSLIWYDINIDETIYNGSFINYISLNIKINNTENINWIKIKINNDTLIEYFNINIINNVDASGIRPSVSPFTISLNPWEWTAKEWNIAFIMLIAGIISLLFAYRWVKARRRYTKVRRLK